MNFSLPSDEISSVMEPLQFVPNTEDLSFVLQGKTKNRKIFHLGFRPTLFGMRIRSGWKDSFVYEIDWCCGDSQSTMNFAYKLLASILNHRIETIDDDRVFYSGIPTISQIKPLHLDTAFMRIVSSLEQSNFVLERNIPGFNSIRNEFFSQHES